MLSIITVDELMYQVHTMRRRRSRPSTHFAAVFYWLLVEAIAPRRPDEGRVTAFLAHEASAERAMIELAGVSKTSAPLRRCGRTLVQPLGGRLHHRAVRLRQEHASALHQLP